MLLSWPTTTNPACVVVAERFGLEKRKVTRPGHTGSNTGQNGWRFLVTARKLEVTQLGLALPRTGTFIVTLFRERDRKLLASTSVTMEKENEWSFTYLDASVVLEHGERYALAHFTESADPHCKWWSTCKTEQWYPQRRDEIEGLGGCYAWGNNFNSTDVQFTTFPSGGDSYARGLVDFGYLHAW